MGRDDSGGVREEWVRRSFAIMRRACFARKPDQCTEGRGARDEGLVWNAHRPVSGVSRRTRTGIPGHDAGIAENPPAPRPFPLVPFPSALAKVFSANAIASRTHALHARHAVLLSP